MKRIKKYYWLFSAVATLFLLSSCEDLSPEDPNNFQADEVDDPDQLAIGMYQAYQKVIANEYLVTELRSDNAITDTGLGFLANIENYNLTPEFGDGSNYWANNYSVILNANLIIVNEDIHSTSSNGQKSLAEAYFMRALSHFNLVRTFENVPYINTVIAQPEDLMRFLQEDPVDMYTFIINDFNTSIEFFRSSGQNGEKNKANLGAAYGFLAKAFLGIPGNPDYSAAYNILSTYLRPDTNEFGYRLLDVNLADPSQGIPEYLSIVDGSNELNDEVLFAVAFEGAASGPSVSSDINIDDQVEVDAQDWAFNMTETGPSNGITLTEDLLSLLLFDPDNVDNEVVEPIRGGNRDTLETGDIDDDDPTIDFTGVTGFDSQQQAKFYNKKYRDDLFSGIDAVVLRYSDILLLFSEALLRGVDSQNVEAIQMYNLVRARVGAPTLAEDGSVFLEVDELLDERRRELAFENQRLWDLIRFGEAKAVEVLSNFSSQMGFNFQDTDLYLPIPRREITSTGGEGVTYNQNDGY